MESGAALASLLGVALGFLGFKGIFEQEELAAIFSLADEMISEDPTSAGGQMLASAKAAAERVQTELNGRS
jgi:hypothetical protein